MAAAPQEQPAQTVRFSEVTEEIEAAEAVQHVSSLTGSGEHAADVLSPEAEEEIRTLSKTLGQSRCQARRLENFSFEPVSLPASRVSSRLPSPVSGS
jgi:hypothetical protein